MNIDQALQIISKKYPLPQSKVQLDLVLSEAMELIHAKTNGFRNASGLSNEKIDISGMLRQYEITPSRWLSIMSDMVLSEQDATIQVASFFEDKSKPKAVKTHKSSDIELEILELEAEALIVILLLK